jgi:hypothetical protein
MKKTIIKKLDMWFTLAIGNIAWTYEFLKSPYKCIYKLGTKEDVQNRLRKIIEMKYAME